MRRVFVDCLYGKVNALTSAEQCERLRVQKTLFDTLLKAKLHENQQKIKQLQFRRNSTLRIAAAALLGVFYTHKRKELAVAERQRIVLAKRAVQSIYERGCTIFRLAQELDAGNVKNTTEQVVYRMRVHGQRLETGYQAVFENHSQVLLRRSYVVFQRQARGALLGKRILMRKYLTFWLADRRQQKLRLRENALERMGQQFAHLLRKRLMKQAYLQLRLQYQKIKDMNALADSRFMESSAHSIINQWKRQTEADSENKRFRVKRYLTLDSKIE